MTTSYRTAACSHCADPGAVAPPPRVGACSSCGRPRDDDSLPCPSCVGRALDLVHRAFPAAAARVRHHEPRRYRRWLALAAVASLGLSFMLGVGGGVALTNHVVDRAPRLGVRALRRVAAPSRPATTVVVAARPAATSMALARPALAAAPAQLGVAPARVPPLPWPAAMLADAGAPTSDPRQLLSRAFRLASAGVDLTLVHTSLSRAAAREVVAPMSWLRTGLRAVPVERDGGLYGVRIEGLTPDSPLGVAGVSEGDVVTAINGRPPLGAGATAAAGFGGAQRPALMVVELVRGGRRVVLAVHWRADAV